MAKKISLKLGYESPFTVFSVFTSEKEYRLAWLINQQLGIELKRIADYSHYFSESQSGYFPIYRHHYKQYRMQMFLLGNKGEEGPIVNSSPVPDFLILFWNRSGLFDLKQFQKDVKKIQQVQTLVELNQKTLAKHEDFFYGLEYFLTEQKVI
ncbi:MAG: IPExxxVDY family protein [Bacteroidales bacterium]|jgi:hypothetical protein|nr:IPExxxVDY family protein [Bacteroidales bacterium]NLM92636.1 IPExxxVDY family protein [Bacteroidales bacterium]